MAENLAAKQTLWEQLKAKASKAKLATPAMPKPRPASEPIKAPSKSTKKAANIVPESEGVEKEVIATNCKGRAIVLP